jgi:hypothetical protein
VKFKTSGAINTIMTISNSNTSYGYTVYAQIYRNGVAYGTQRDTGSTKGTVLTFSQALSYVAGDVLSLRLKSYYSTSTGRSCGCSATLKFLCDEEGEA